MPVIAAVSQQDLKLRIHLPLMFSIHCSVIFLIPEAAAPYRRMDPLQMHRCEIFI